MHKFTFTMIALLLGTATAVQADVISLTTSKAVGEELTLALNTGVSAELTWGSGDSETVSFTGVPTTVTIKDESLTITTSSTITLFYAPSDGLTALDVSEATSLKKLFCPANELTTLSLTTNTALEELDCQANELSTLSLTKCTSLTDLNCAQNNLTSLTYSSTAAKIMETLIFNENSVGTLRNYSSMSALETIWGNNNSLTSLSLKNSSDLKQLCMSSNALATLTLGEKDALTDLWVENNELTEIDFSSGAGALVTVSVNDNALDTIIWDSSCKSTIDYFYAQNNNLYYNSFPTASRLEAWNVAPQSAYHILDAAIVGTTYNLSGYLRYDGFSTAHKPSYVAIDDETGDTLVSGTDYGITTQGSVKFYTAHTGGVTIYATSSSFGSTLIIDAIPVFEDEDSYDAYIAGIPTVAASTAATLGISIGDGAIVVSAASATPVNIYNLAGQQVAGTVVSGTKSIAVPAGVYIVNGTKVLVP